MEKKRWEVYAGEKKPSMKRRCDMHDYRERGIYMITVATEGRRQLFGTLAGDPGVRIGEESPHVVLSPLGMRVRECWQDIQRYHPAVKPLKLCIMPDHIHGLLFVQQKMEEHLGDVVRGFKTGTNKAARELGVVAAALPQLTGRGAGNGGTPGAQSGGAAGAQSGGAAGAQSGGAGGAQGGAAGVGYVAAVPQHYGHYDRAHGLLWEPGYHDRILLRRGQLDRLRAYLDDNPRRLLLKRLHPEYFTHLGTIVVAGVAMQAMGNRFLLDRPAMVQVQCSRHLYDHEIEQQKEALLERCVCEGAVVVSPCISRGEKTIATAALDEGIALIVLLLKGFPPLFKPQPRYLEACIEGRLLMLSPFAFQNERLTDMRARCLHLNELASQLCQ